ncbi:MAG: DUF308 domain-containing protein [Muribaculaceae bacterium]
MIRKSSGFLVNTFVFLAGLLLTLLYDEARLMEGVVMVLGVMFLVPSVIALILMMAKASTTVVGDYADEPRVGIGNGGVLPMLGGICFGLSLILRPLLFVEILSYIFAAILLLGGIYHIVVLFITSRKVGVSLWLYVLPLLVAVAGFVLLVTDVRTVEKWVNLITGISLMSISLSSLLEYVASRRLSRHNAASEVSSGHDE